MSRLFVTANSEEINCGNISEIVNAANVTISCWCKRPATNIALNLGMYLSGDVTDRFNITLFTDNNGYFVVGGTVSSFGRISSWGGTTWHHIVMVFDGGGVGNNGRLQVYRDGVLQTIGFFSGTIPALTSSIMDEFNIGFHCEQCRLIS